MNKMHKSVELKFILTKYKCPLYIANEASRSGIDVIAQRI